MRPPDAAFADPKQALLYDEFDDDRRDLALYVELAQAVGAIDVVDVGCGTGCLALLLADCGMNVVGVDPAAASIEVAQHKPGANRIHWITDDATALGAKGIRADVVTMTGNVAQVFVSDDDWHATLAAIANCLRPGGWFIFETRRPEARAWESWGLPPTAVTLSDGREAVATRRVTDVALPLVTFEGSTTIGAEVLFSSSTLRFRDRDEVESDLAQHGFRVEEVREAPDRPGLEFVFLARANS